MLRFTDIISNIINSRKSVCLRFLTLDEQTHLSRIKDAVLDGGYKDAERKRAYLFGAKLGNIIPVKIIYNQKYLTLSHQNILGTLLSLGITLDSIGDILPKQGVFFITEEISKEIFTSFREINHVAIDLEVFKGDVHSEKELEEHRTTVESMRLDLIISKICKTSRSDAQTLIQKELIKLNHQIHIKPTTLIKNKDIISIRKYGRFQIIDSSSRSKKGKIVLIYAKYV